MAPGLPQPAACPVGLPRRHRLLRRGFTYLRRYVSPRGIGVLPAATVQVTLAAGVAVILAPWAATAPVRLSPAIIGSVLALGALGTGIAYIWNTSIVANWGATIASTVTYVIPVVGVILGILVLSETLTWNEPAGAVIVILGILTAQNRLAPVARLIPRPLRREGRPAAPRRQGPVPLLPRCGTGQMIAISPRVPSAVLLEEIRHMYVTGDPAGELVCGPVDVLQASGVAFSVQEHAPIMGQANAERVLGLPADQMLKTMVFRADAATVLVALPARRRVHYGKFARAVGVQRSVLRQAEPDDLARIGMMPGGASPVCGVDGVITVFDVSASEMDTVYCGSGRVVLGGEAPGGPVTSTRPPRSTTPAGAAPARRDLRPVAPIVRFAALTRPSPANGTEYGLVSYLYSADLRGAAGGGGTGGRDGRHQPRRGPTGRAVRGRSSPGSAVRAAMTGCWIHGDQVRRG